MTGNDTVFPHNEYVEQKLHFNSFSNKAKAVLPFPATVLNVIPLFTSCYLSLSVFPSPSKGKLIDKFKHFYSERLTFGMHGRGKINTPLEPTTGVRDIDSRKV